MDSERRYTLRKAIVALSNIINSKKRNSITVDIHAEIVHTIVTTSKKNLPWYRKLLSRTLNDKD